MASSEGPSLLRRFHQLQEERVQTYQLFDQGHQAYLASAPQYNFHMYRQLVHEISQAFKRISEEILDIERKLRIEHRQSEVAKFIRTIQDDEKLKLELTSKYQLAKQNVLDHDEEISYQEDLEDLKAQIHQVIERINEHIDELKYESEELLDL